MTTNDDRIEWVVERLQCLQAEHEEDEMLSLRDIEASCRALGHEWLDRYPHCCIDCLERGLAKAYRAGQEAMRERCVALCRTRLQGHLQGMLEATDDCTHDQALGMADEAEECAEAIRALEVE